MEGPGVGGCAVFVGGGVGGGGGTEEAFGVGVDEVFFGFWGKRLKLVR